MQAVLLYGRVVARTLVSGINAEFQPTHKNNSTACALKNKQIQFLTAVAGLGKSQSQARVQPKWTFGDDACFTSQNKKGEVIGVADGVGGWRDYGVDPSKISVSLMSTCERLVQQGKFTVQEPTRLLIDSYHEIQQSKEPIIGSCTACLVALHKEDKMVYTSNLGDSGYMHIRHGAVLNRSQEQQHYFNTPFQLAIVPGSMEGLVLSDRPEAAMQSSFGVQEGDIILVGTDGLFDNMNEETILNHVSKLKEHNFENLQKLANSILQHAHQLAFDPDHMSPFAENAVRNGYNVKGGKPDDITVLLAAIADDQSIGS